MTEAIAEVRAAAGFLTRLPVGAVGNRVGAGAFGLVGAGIGLLAGVPLVVLGGVVPLIAAVLAIAVVVVVSGGVHLDGLADTADALAAPSPEAERARTDPRLGSGGVAAIALDVGLAVATLTTLAARDAVLAAAAVVIAATVSRSAAPVAALAWTRVGGEVPRGAGAWFVERVGRASFVAVFVTTLVVVAVASALAGFAIAVGTAWGAAAGAALAVWVVARRGQLDGDGYGAVIELTFLAVLTGIAVAGSLA